MSFFLLFKNLTKITRGISLNPLASKTNVTFETGES